MGRISAIKPNPEKRVRIGLKKCGDCGKQFTVKVGTVFEQSHIPLNVWLQAIALLTASKKGFSANQFARTLGVSLKAAWFMAHRIREAMADANAIMGGGGGVLEIDETFLGNEPTLFVNGKGWRTKRGSAGMQKIVTVVERQGRARSVHVKNLQKPEIVRALEIADRDSHLNTDSAQHYRRLGLEFLSHEMVDHTAREYVRGEGSHQHRRGNFLHLQARHEGDLPALRREAPSPLSGRVRLPVFQPRRSRPDDTARADNALQGVSVGKRLTYRTTSARRPGAEGRVVW